MWLTVLSDQLPVIALVGRYPANKLMGREVILERPKPLDNPAGAGNPHPVLIAVSRGYSGLEGRFLTRYSPFRH